MDQFVGTNAFIDDPLDKLAVPVGFVREYHSWQWDTEAPDHQVRCWMYHDEAGEPLPGPQARA